MSFPYKPLLAVPDHEDIALHKLNCNVALINERLCQLVPIFQFIGAQVDEVNPQKTVLSVPLLERAMNQNGTHQGTVFYILADYTLGLGIFAALPGSYSVGVHDRCDALPLQFWLKSGHVEHLAPGTGTIRGEVEIPIEKILALRQQLLRKGRGELSETVRFYQGDQLIAEATHTIGLYAELPRVSGVKASALQTQKLKTSALMIAGLREDPISNALAGDQGIAVANRMAQASPQLPTLVAARTQHLVEYLNADGRSHQQVVVLGAGLDPKPIQYANTSQHWFLCDLPDMLKDRHARINQLGQVNNYCISVPVDLRLSDWPEKLTQAGFDPTSSSLIILEGVSMYLSATDLRKTLDNIHDLCHHKQSRVWFDHVTEEILEMDLPEVKSFLSSIARLGEPFVTGFADPVQFTGVKTWSLIDHKTASQVLEIQESVHDEYRFALLGKRMATETLSVAG